MGPVKATAARAKVAQTLEPGRPVVVIGLGGGLVEGLTPGDVVVASELQITTGATPIAMDYASEIAERLTRVGLSVHEEPVVCSPKIITGATERTQAASQGAIAVEMESYWCAPLASQHPFAVVRVLLDLPEYELFSLRLPRTVRRAWRSLVSVSRVLDAWSPTTLNTAVHTKVGEA
jgi:4-hydroxy-3-methylbut-2-enyl diphosphate reductase